MNLIIKSKKLKLTPRVKSYVTQKFSKYNKLLPYPTVLEIVLSEEPGRAGKKSQKIRLNCEIPRYKLIHMERSSEDILASVDLIQRRFEQVVIRFRSKRLKPPRSVQIVRTMQDALTWVPRRLTGKKGRLAAKGPRIVKRRRFQMTNKPMTEREAIEQMKLINHDFYLFFNANSNRYAVLYKRKDGNYAIIEPQLGEGEE
jgi:putative sigma-54 modulation protein